MSHVTLMYAAGFEQHDSREISVERQTGPGVPPGGSVFGPFILSDVLKLCRLPCARNFKLEATLRQTASAAGILNCGGPYLRL